MFNRFIRFFQFNCWLHLVSSLCFTLRMFCFVFVKEEMFFSNEIHFRPSIRGYVRSSEGQWLYWTSYVVFLVTYIALVCCRSAGRRFPTNMILLGILVNEIVKRNLNSMKLLLIFRHFQ